MSIAKKIIDLAKSNLNAILERAAETADPRRRLASIPDAELEAELARRRSARLTEEKIADAKAKIDAAPMPDRAERERVAREREARVREARAKREREAAASASARRTASAGSGAGPRPRAPSGGATPRGRDAQLARYYDRLEVPYGSNWDAVKTAYRKLMRKYHPDMHANKSAEARRAATEVAQALTQAYNELEKVLLGGPNRPR
jgi:hypothetical protein